MAPPKTPLAERLKRRTAQRGPKQCWPWLGAISKHLGYGIMTGPYVRGQSWKTLLYAHRVAYEVHKGSIPIGYQVAHLCHNRNCVNPAHLEAVLQTENIRQTVEAKNHATMRSTGVKNPAHKLTRKQVNQIRTSNMSHSEASRHYGVADTTIRSIRKGKTWVAPTSKRSVLHYR